MLIYDWSFLLRACEGDEASILVYRKKMSSESVCINVVVQGLCLIHNTECVNTQHVYNMYLYYVTSGGRVCHTSQSIARPLLLVHVHITLHDAELRRLPDGPGMAQETLVTCPHGSHRLNPQQWYCSVDHDACP